MALSSYKVKRIDTCCLERNNEMLLSITQPQWRKLSLKLYLVNFSWLFTMVYYLYIYLSIFYTIQVFIEPERGCGRFNRPLAPVVSDVIFDRKAMSDLQITKLSHILAPLRGGLEMIVLCDKVSKGAFSLGKVSVRHDSFRVTNG